MIITFYDFRRTEVTLPLDARITHNIKTLRKNIILKSMLFRRPTFHESLIERKTNVRLKRIQSMLIHEITWFNHELSYNPHILLTQNYLSWYISNKLSNLGMAIFMQIFD